MKALSIVTAVLVVSACAQGTLALEAFVPLEGLRPGETIEIKIIGDIVDTSQTPIDGYLLVWGPGSINGGRIVYPGGGDYQDAPDWVIFDPMEMPDDYSWWMLGSPIPEVTSPYSGVLIDKIMFTCQGTGIVNVSLVNGETFELIDSILIPQVPEPCTLGLLGCGAAIMFRKKRA